MITKSEKIIIFSAIFFLIPLFSMAEFKDNVYYSYQDYLSKISYHPYIANLAKGDGMVVAVIDSGVWLQHPDIIGANWINQDEIPNNGIDDDHNGYTDDYYGWNFIDDNNDLTTKGSHGTGVAGIIAAQHNTMGIVGIAPNAKIMPLIVCDKDGCSDSDIQEAIYYASKNGANIINLSLGSVNGYTGYSSSYNDPIKYAYDRDVVIIASAGNGDTESSQQIGHNLDFSKVSPISNDVDGINMVLGVGALALSGERASWSHYGTGVDLLAPGEDIISLTVPVYESDYSYKYMSGTSFSAPMVSAAAALLKSLKPNLKNWEIIDQLSKAKKLDLDAILRDGTKSCNILSMEKNIVENQDSILFTGEHIPSDPRLYVQNNTVFVAVNSSALNFLDASKFRVRISDLGLNPGTYTLVGRDNICDARNISFTIKESEANTESVSSPVAVQEETVTSEEELIQETVNIDINFSRKMSGKILLQVEKNGEAWYVYPEDNNRYFLGRPTDAFNVMKKLGLGATHKFIMSYTYFPNNVIGKILLDVEDNGKAYYINPSDKKAYYLGRPADAFKVMRELGLGITNINIKKINIKKTN